MSHQPNEAAQGAAQIQSSFEGGSRQPAPGGMRAMLSGNDEVGHGSEGEEHSCDEEEERHDEEDEEEGEIQRRNSLVMVSVRHVPAGGDDGGNSGGDVVVHSLQGGPGSPAKASENAEGFGDASGSGSARSVSLVTLTLV